MQILAVLDTVLDNLNTARQGIDALLKFDIEQTRMRYSFAEYKDVLSYLYQAYEQDVKNLMKSCIGNSIFVQGLVKQINDNTEVCVGKSVTVEWKYHPRFGVLKIVDKKSRASVSS